MHFHHNTVHCETSYSRNVLDIREARTPALDEVRENLIVQLRAERARTKRQEYLAGLIKDHPLAINEIELSKLAVKP